MIRFLGNSSGPICRGYNASDDFSVPGLNRQVIVSQASTANASVKDASVTQYTSATLDNIKDVTPRMPLAIRTLPTYVSSDLLIATVDTAGVVTRIADGTVDIAVSVPTRGTRVFTQTFARQMGQTASTLNNFLSGSLGIHLVSAIAAKLSGKTAPTFNGTGGASSTLCDIYTSIGVRNTSGWWGNVDLTCIPRNGADGGVLITPKHALFAWHYGANNATFDDNAGNSYTATIASQQQIGTSDIRLVTFATALSSAITPAKLMPANWMTYLPQSNYGYPCVFTNQDRKLLIGDTVAYSAGAEMGISRSADAARSPWWYLIRSMDSGSAAGMIINGVYTHLTNWHAYRGITALGPRDSDFITQINTAISGSGYSVSTVDLSGFNSYS